MVSEEESELNALSSNFSFLIDAQSWWSKTKAQVGRTYTITPVSQGSHEQFLDAPFLWTAREFLQWSKNDTNKNLPIECQKSVGYGQDLRLEKLYNTNKNSSAQTEESLILKILQFIYDAIAKIIIISS